MREHVYAVSMRLDFLLQRHIRSIHQLIKLLILVELIIKIKLHLFIPLLFYPLGPEEPRQLCDSHDQTEQGYCDGYGPTEGHSESAA